jgi:hypothetical protein
VTPLPPNAPSKGSIEEGTYKNPSIGVEITPADNLHFEEPDMKGTPGTVPLLIVVKAIEGGLLSGLFSPRSVMIFDADALAYYPADQRNVDRYLKKVIRANESDGYQITNSGTVDQISGIPVTRGDFVKGDIHETVLVTIHNAYAFVFFFAGSDSGVINKLIRSTKVKLTP